MRGRIAPGRRWLALLFGVALPFTAPLAAQPATGIAVVVHSDVPVDSLSLSDLRRLVLGDREFWPGGVRVTLLLRAPVARERDVVLKSLCQMTEAQFRQHWIGKVFRADTALAPKIVYSTPMALDLVNGTPGAITFVEAAQVGRGHKVLRIDGHLPGEKDYPLP
jgi:hypothetical protein